MVVPIETDTSGDDRSLTRVDPRAPRFGQSITAFGLLLGVVLSMPVLVYAIAIILITPVITRWRVDPYLLVWTQVVRPRVGPPTRREAAAPHRFTKLLGATGTGLASAFLLAGVPVAGYVVAAGIAGLAGLAAVTGVCVGCRMYQQVSFFRRFEVI